MSPAEQPDSVLSATRRDLIYHGYLPIPVLGKFPRIDGWQNLEPALADVDRLINQYPDHISTGLKTGNLVAIDVDITDEKVSRLVQERVAAIPNASYALVRIGKAPKAMFFFRSSEAGKKKLTPFYLINGGKHRVEVMRAGQQVVAFGIHPDTKQPYEWVGDSPLDVEFDALPEIDEGEIDSFLVDTEAIMAQHGKKVEKEKQTVKGYNPKPNAAATAGDGIWAKLKANAMANLDLWVPHLGLSGTKRYQQGFLARADFRPSTSSKGKSGAARGLSVEFSPAGICDHADGNQGYNPIDIVAVALGIKPPEAADWLRGYVGDEREHIPANDLADFVANNLRKNTHAAHSISHTTEQVTPIQAANDNTPSQAKKPSYPGITSSGDLVRGFVPPDYFLDGVAQTGFLYSTTAMTGTGKTAVLLLLIAHAALGKPLAGLEVKQGRGLYFAGENPDDVTMRWIAMAHHMDFNPDNIDVHFIKGAFSIPQMFERIRKDVEKLGGVDMIVIDTSAAYFQGQDENSNTELGKHARELRELTTLKGAPVVFVAAHPVKNAEASNLLPRGGGAFLNEVDGNLVLMKGDTCVKLHWHGKHRGVDFDPIMFALKTVTAPALRDSKGRDVPTVMAAALSKGEVRDRASTARRDEDAILLLIDKDGTMSMKGMADELQWRDENGDVHRRRATAAAEKLKRAKLVEYSDRNKWTITTKGYAELVDVKAQRFSEESAAKMMAKWGGK
ncbi:AAA family ATPase [Phyllobacterium meliloti]|uniref:AAA family ATPase n=1 Tax=Phyllobacterium meliloti TaxID=555317 RepID=UPI001D14A32F|nr:AAA family ATPase [Phyllobacterium sp. T1293]UGX87104.1 AAA family ATPase [Phyllobacterium sp. T1293]